MSNKPKIRILSIALIAVISFLFAFSPAIFSNATSTNVTPASKPTPSLLPPGQTMPAVVQRLPTKIYDPSASCTASTCVATTDIDYADVFITDGTKLVATVAVCGDGLSVTYSMVMKAWIYSDYGCSELEAISASNFNVTTLATGIDGAAGITYSANYKMFYVAQFGYGEVAAVTMKGVVTEINLTSNCSDGDYPEFDAVGNTGIVYVNARYECVVGIEGTTIKYSTSAVYGGVGIAVNLANKGVYVADGVYDEIYECTPTLSSCTVIATYDEGLWGMWYMTYDKSIWFTNYTADTIIPLNYKNVFGNPIYTGEENDAGCAQAKGPQLSAPEYYYGEGNFILNVKTGKSEHVTLGEYYPFSCIYAGGNNN